MEEALQPQAMSLWWLCLTLVSKAIGKQHVVAISCRCMETSVAINVTIPDLLRTPRSCKLITTQAKIAQTQVHAVKTLPQQDAIGSMPIGLPAAI
ncbi:MAG: hypothetical protein UT30_C0012G0031 [Candidatus Uhrbacteria bacterium GW2011_GWF2_39_13]|uniref:Uncharacterized protein n=1 Tax=Candidatus Uhrbacteria bacterium GW2011_GWF2_39_13 TaxID=1618995 RepID=A0A0G0Q148_9BACT|nr:MAG: hypothetical protein UT30_C0012G0031 [Candidatus Uhrbacteria bacterium GW2011_GWF2_39_13]